ncbi:MAG: GspE/PulE family protein [Gammaproteobacteria bacterium]|nr:GspE/PulE family protein [Gammaproteobacteria bacterium]MDH5652920.1 GspE/PulE family protein [Gammaproteobacteria bacterium]
MESAVEKQAAVNIPYLYSGVVDWENDPLSGLLIEQGKLKEHEFRQLQNISSVRNEALSIALIRYGLLSETDLADAMSRLTGLDCLTEDAYPENDLAPDTLSLRFMKNAYVVPVAEYDGKLELIMADPRDIETIRSVGVTTGAVVIPRLGLSSHILAAIDKLAQHASLRDGEAAAEQSDAGMDIESGHDENLDVAQLRDLASEAPTIRTVNSILQEAIQLRASDIHFEPGVDGLRIRFRVDGVLRIGSAKLLKNAAAINSRIKIMARLDIAERRIPQDGRIQIKVSGKELDIRVSTIPTLFGENIVIRLLDKSSVVLDFAHLGFDAATLQKFSRVLSAPDGIFLVTGPTGCGKTTTLYTALNKINTIERKLITVEDPVEYQLAGINQIAIQPKIGLTFDKVLRAILRQDPDVIMVGEMRDTETARIAVQAALTGHLVLSTLHTNDAVTGITRLLDMGVDDYLVASTLNGVLAQRLLRRLCPACKQPQADTEQEYTATGCEQCGGSGYHGRIAITEFLLVNDAFRELILTRSDRASLKEAAKQAGMVTLYESGMQLVKAGITSRQEVLKVASEV